MTENCDRQRHDIVADGDDEILPDQFTCIPCDPIRKKHGFEVVLKKDKVGIVAANVGGGCRGHGYPELARVGHIIGRRARYTDATIIGPDLLTNEALKAKVIDGALFESGRPILLIPHGSKPTLRPKRILLAWDSGMECTRAAREALDIMASAEEVHVTLVDPDTSSIANGAEPGADIAAYLAHHGIKVDVDRLPSGGESIAGILKQHATDISADLIVMGGYGHSRTSEWVFGGVTRSMIDDPRLPVLMAR